MKQVSCSECGHAYPIKQTGIVDGKRVCHKCKTGIKRFGSVTVWQMTEKERIAYIEKYPIKPTPKDAAFAHGMRKDDDWY